MRTWNFRLALSATLIALASLTTTTATAAAPGALTQISNGFACLESPAGGGCASGRFVSEPTAVAVSPDGKFAYAVSAGSQSGAANDADSHGTIALFSRNPLTGALTQLPGTAGCVGEEGFDGLGGHTCAVGHGLRGASALTISPDGSTVYVGSSGEDNALSTPEHAIAIFKRDSTTGQLSQAPGLAGCLSDGTDPDCTGISSPMRELHALVVSADGKNLYGTASQGSSPADTGAVVAFSRDLSTGALTQLAGTWGCIANAHAGCAPGRALGEPYGITFAPGGNELYIAASEGVSSAGDQNGAVVVLNRNASTGVLTEPAGAGGCINATGKDQSNVAGTCTALTTGASLHDANSVVVSSDGANVYVAAQGFTGDQAKEYGALNSFARDTVTGALTELPGTSGCVSQDGSDGSDLAAQCATGRAMFEPTGVAIAPDGSSVYLASSDTPSSIDTFARNASTGVLTQLSGADGCISENGSDGAANTCAVGLGIPGASEISVTATAGCQNVYLAAQDASAIASFVRQPTSCQPPDISFPTVSVTTPRDGAHYLQRAVIRSLYACSDPDGPADVASCTGTAPAGQPIDAGTVGVKTFTVTAADQAGNRGSKTVHYTVDPLPGVASVRSPAKVAKGSAAVTLTCPGATAGCNGTLTLTIRVKRVTGRRGHRHTSFRTVTIGHARFSILTGAKRTFSVRLSASALTRLAHAKHHRLGVSARIGSNGHPLTLILTTKPKRRRR